MKNRSFILLLLISLGSIGILLFSFKESYTGLGIIIAAVFTLGLISRLLTGFVNTPKWLFRLRFIIYEIGYGIMIGLILFLSKSFKYQTFIISDLVKYLILASILAIIWGISKFYLKFRKLIKNPFNSEDNKAILYDSATFKGSEGQIFFGLLVLTNDRLIFYSSKNNDCLFELKLAEINPTIERSKFLKIPRGLNLIPGETKVHVRFPYYWLKAINQEKTNTRQQTL